MKENNEKKVKNSKENSKLIKAFPKHISALDKRRIGKMKRIRYTIEENNNVMSRYDHKIETSVK